MDAATEFVQWARAEGVIMRKIQPLNIEAGGIGLVASRTIHEGEVVLEVPTKLVLGITSVPKVLSRKLPPSMTTHGTLTAELVLNKAPEMLRWKAAMPTPDALTYFPMLWTNFMRRHLPPSAQGLLVIQQDKFYRDYDSVVKAFPHINCQEYKEAWLLVNSRTFSYSPTPRTDSMPAADRIALVPVADMFNHADVAGVDVSWDRTGFTFKAKRRFLRGQELCISYGDHGNDFLLVEYGFIMDDNKWDEVGLDEAIIPSLPVPLLEKLRQKGYLGCYRMGRTEVCTRTQALLRLTFMPDPEWTEFLLGRTDPTLTQRQANAVLSHILHFYDARLTRTVRDVETIEYELPYVIRMVRRRWQQIQGIVRIQMVARFVPITVAMPAALAAVVDPVALAAPAAPVAPAASTVEDAKDVKSEEDDE